MKTYSQNYYLDLTKEEQTEIAFLLNREPNSVEKELIGFLWREDFAKKAIEKWFKKLLRIGENIIKTNNRNESYLQIGNKVVKFSVSAQNNLNEKFASLAATQAMQNVIKTAFSNDFEPLALLDSLRIGDFEDAQNQRKLVEIVKAISDFSKAANIPVVGGEIFFNQSFNDLPIINAFSLAATEIENLKKRRIILSEQLIYFVGASPKLEDSEFEEVELTQETFSTHFNHKKLSPESLQEKLLIDFCKRPVKERSFVVMKSIAKGGIINALVKILKGKKGADIHLEEINTIFESNSDFNILFSEIQASALFVVSKNNKMKFETIIENSNLTCHIIGKINSTENIQIFEKDEIIAQIPVEILESTSIPERNLNYKAPDRSKIREYSIKDVTLPENLKEVGLFLAAHKNIASKKYLTKHFEIEKSHYNAFQQLSDAAIIPFDENFSLVAGVDCNSRYVDADPQTGAAIAVAEAARNIVCSGGKPLAISVCINIGNHKNPEVFWQFTEIIKGINKVSRLYNLPIINIKANFDNFKNLSGNQVNIYPSPVIGMLGTIPLLKKPLTLCFKQKGDMIFLLGETRNSISSSLYLKSFHKVKNSPPPYFCLHTANQLQQIVQQLSDKELINSAHDISNGGLFITLLEAGLQQNLGFDITTDAENRVDAFLFGEAQNRIVVTVSSELETEFIDFMIDTKFPFLTLGHITKGDIRIDDESWGNIVQMKDVYENSMERNLKF